MENLLSKLNDFKSRLKNLRNSLDLDEKKQKLSELQKSAVQGDFWQDINQATAVMEQINNLKSEIDEIESLENRTEDLSEILSEKDALETVRADIEHEIKSLEKGLENVEFKLYFTDPYDSGSAILSVHSGQGGTEAMDWAEMIFRMYIRFADKSNWKTILINESKGDEAGIKSASVEINGSYAYGYLKKEVGTHRLVRKSPFNADNLRQTSFALVEVLPVIEEKSQTVISPDDLEIETFRSSGPGGQNVQKVETAVRIKHLPTGITVSAQSERSQSQNKENAMKLLVAKVHQLEEEKRKANEKNLKGEFKTASWGNQIRNYILHPYKLVKDVRTGVESNDPESILNGELDTFVEAEIKLKT